MVARPGGVLGNLCDHARAVRIFYAESSSCRGGARIPVQL